MNNRLFVNAKLMLLTGLIIALSACAHKPASTNIVPQAWLNSDYPGWPVNKILVIGISDDSSAKATYEDSFVESMLIAGSKGIASYHMSRNSGHLSEADMQKLIEESGCDAVVIAMLESVEQDRNASASENITSFSKVLESTLYEHYLNTTSSLVPGHLTDAKSIQLLTTIYTAQSSGEAIWAGRSNSINPSSKVSTILSATNSVVKQLVEKGLVE